MTESHVEAEIQRRIARVRAEAERKRQERAELAARRTDGLAKRHAAKLRRIGRSLAPTYPTDNTTLAASSA